MACRWWVRIGTTTAGSKLAVYGDLFIEGASRYLNFGTATGTSGYGFRDNAGTLEFKNSGGSWQGVTTATSGPTFHVHKNGSNQTTTSGVITLLTWATESYDTNNNFDLSTERFTPTVPGKYILTTTIYCQDATTYCVSYIYKNGSRVASNINRASADLGSTVTTILDMNGTTDYVEAYARQDGGTTIAGTPNDATIFTGALIAPVNATAGGWQNDGTQSFLADSTDLVGIGTSTPWAKLAVNPLAGDANQFVVGSSTRTSFIITPNGNVGIGTTTPGSLFSIHSIANFQTGTSTIYENLNVQGQLKVGTGSIFLNGSATSTYSSGIQSSALNLLSGGALTINGTSVLNATTLGSGVTASSLTSLGTLSSLAITGVMTVNNTSGNNSGVDLLEGGSRRWIMYNQGSNDTLYVLDADSGTAVFMSQNDTSWQSGSDVRLKENVQTLSVLDRLNNFRAVSFDWRQSGAHDLGVIAQELFPIFPEIVHKGSDDPHEVINATSTSMWGVRYDRLGAIALQGVKELDLKLEHLATTTQDSEEGSFTTRFFSSLFTRITAWLADAQNGITDFFAQRVHTQELCVDDVCVTREEFLRMKEGQSAAAGAAATAGSDADTPSGSSAPEADGDADAATTTTPATLTLNGNNPAQWQADTSWQDNLGALFTHGGQSETIYSTTTVDTTLAGTTTLDYWAVVPSTQQWFYTMRDVVVSAPANDNPLPANDNAITPLSATGTDATTTLQ